MTVSLWRIATDTPTYEATDLSGTGAKISGGRWNRKGNAVAYTSTNIALACLETVVHLIDEGLPLNRYLVQIEVPDEVWDMRLTLKLAVGWDAQPAGKVSLDAGDEWLALGKSALLVVPSVIVPEETNVLINPGHPDAKKIKATKIRKWLYDARI